MKKLALLGLAAGLLSISACKKEDPEVVTFEDVLMTKMELIDSETVGDYTLSIFSESELLVGYNELNFLLKDSDGELITDYSIHAHPMMDMGMMQHTTPHGHGSFIEEDYGLFMNQYIFIMSSMAGEWSLEATVEVDGQSIVFDFVPDVAEPSESRLISFISETGSEETYFVSLIGAEEFEVGENDFKFSVHKRETMMSFPAEEDLTIEIEPWMPTMGHGSPNNVNPTHSMHGYYDGVVNFTMTGFWELRFTIRNSDGEAIAENLAFDVTL